MKTVYIILAVIVVLGLFILGYVKYFKDKTTTPTGSMTQTTDQSAVAIKNMSFSSANLEIPKGTKVVWTNEDSTNHTVTSNDNKFDSGQLKNGKKFEFTFEQSGEYAYHCSVHPSMTAKVIVK